MTNLRTLSAAPKVTDWLHDVKDPQVLQAFFDVNSVPIDEASKTWREEASFEGGRGQDLLSQLRRRVSASSARRHV
jgi:hypothetical protein